MYMSICGREHVCLCLNLWWAYKRMSMCEFMFVCMYVFAQARECENVFLWREWRVFEYTYCMNVNSLCQVFNVKNCHSSGV